MRALLVVNPKATTTSDYNRDLLIRALAGTVDLQVAYTTRRGHAVSLARDAAREGFDLLVTPTTGQPPLELDALVPPAGQPLAMLPRFLSIQCFAIPFSVTGQPAISLPLHQSEQGLPIGVQFVGPPAGEEMLIALAAQLEQARPWADRRPPVAVPA